MVDAEIVRGRASELEHGQEAVELVLAAPERNADSQQRSNGHGGGSHVSTPTWQSLIRSESAIPASECHVTKSSPRNVKVQNDWDLQGQVQISGT